MDELKGKRLLVLGGRLWMKTIESFCRENGITIITAGNSPKSKLNLIADEYYNVDSTNADAMKRLIRERNIDGVYLGGSEPVIAAASKYVNEMGMPCYCTFNQWEALQNKAKFKEFCVLHGLPVAPKYSYDELMNPEKRNEFPVVTKPVDGSGSHGFSVCRNIEELKKGYMLASDESFSGEVLIEKYLKNDGIVVFYTMSNGELYFSGIEDKYSVQYKEQGSYVAGMHLFESNLCQEFRNRYEKKLKSLLDSISISEGSFWIEVFTDSSDFYFNEVGYRYSGSVSVYPVDYFYGINQVAADIYYALMGKSKIFGFNSLFKDELNRKSKYAIYSIHIKPGVIQDIIGFEDIINLDNVIEIPITMNIGDQVKKSGSIGQVFAFVHFIYDTNEELRNMIRHIQKTLKVLDESGNNMVNHMINPDTIVIR